MARIAEDRLQPSLLDRLTDAEPQARRESPDRRVLSLAQLRQAVLRDVGWLLNTAALDAAADLEEFSLVRASTLNYGVPDLTGRSLSGLDPVVIARMIRDALRAFEPRIIDPDVRLIAGGGDHPTAHNALAFEIRGQLWAQPAPVPLVLETEMDLESGQVTVRSRRGD
jgi:type VI secretion system protein ImpF